MRVLIADDHEIVRRGLVLEIAPLPDWEVVAEAATGREAVLLARDLKPDLIVLDMSMPELNGLAAARQILAEDPKARLIMLTVHESEQLVREALSAGVRGFVLKSDAGNTLVAALKAVLAGRPYFNSRIAQLVIEGFVRGAPEGVGAAALSAREQEIVQLLAEGKSNKEVAQALGISVKTAETHRSNIMRKRGFDSLADLVRYAIRNGMIDP